MKDLLTITDFTPGQLQDFIDLSGILQKEPRSVLAGKNVLFVFEKPSLRTKIGTEAAINHLAGRVIHADPRVVLEFDNNPFGCRESLSDTIRNISLWCDAIFARVFHHESLEKMAAEADIPIINALCDRHHPMQALADLYTIQQNFGRERKVTVTFVGDANNVARSLIQIGLMFGHHMRFAGPENYFWTPEEIARFEELAREYGGTFAATTDAREGVRDSDVIYTDSFISMGEENVLEQKLLHFTGYQVNEELMAEAGSDAVFMHCLPAHRGIEVTDAVLDHPNSWVHKQSRNRMIVSKGVFARLISRSEKGDELSSLLNLVIAENGTDNL